VERDLDSLIIRANSELKKIALWFRANNMAVPHTTWLKTLYFALIQSHLSYCPVVLSGISQHNFNQIRLIEKKQSESLLPPTTLLVLLLFLHSCKSYCETS
jgi:hypothetical protein